MLINKLRGSYLTMIPDEVGSKIKIRIHGTEEEAYIEKVNKIANGYYEVSFYIEEKYYID
jgi:hypothetical protein